MKCEGNVGLVYEGKKRSKARGVFDNDFKDGDNESMDLDVIALPPQKNRRKLSPTLWDMEHAKCSVKGFQKSPLSGCSSVNQSTNFNDDQEPGQLDEEDFTNAPNISTSRWAYDNDLEEFNLEEKGGAALQVEKMKERRSSPESGVTQEHSDGSDIRLSGPGGGHVLRVYSGDELSESHLENDDWMELHVNDYETCVASHLNLDSDDASQYGAPQQARRNMLQGCRSVFEYEKLGKISEGSYGIVYKAKDKKRGELVALKKMKMGNEREGFPAYCLREINILLSLNHPSIVNVREVVVDDSFDGFDNLYMVMDYVEHDLRALMQSRKQYFSQSEVKCLMLQLLEGVKYLHDNWVLHRDLKTSNLLLNNKGELKICDFGMSRQYGSPLNPYTSLVVTLWYRAPELLLGAKEYSTAMDIWSVGCIMAELLTNKPLFDGKSEIEQLNKIFRTLGTPNDKIWPDYSQLPGFKVNFVQQPYNLLHTKFPRASFTGSSVLSEWGLDLLSRLLTYDPEKRITTEEALNHRWFQEVPLPKSCLLL